MMYRGVQYTVAAGLEPNVWRWCFQIGDIVTSGKTKTTLSGLAARRAQIRINAALKRIEAAMPVTV